MNMPLKKSETSIALSAPGLGATASAKILSLGAPKRPPLAERLLAFASAVAARIIPPIVVIALVLAVWEILCRKQGANACEEKRPCENNPEEPSAGRGPG